jgi:hypothetical protein
MTYSSKQECYNDVLASLRLGILDKEEIELLIDYYRDMEYYECCQGILDAYDSFKKEMIIR